MTTSTLGHSQSIASAGKRIVSVVIGSALLLLGLMEFGMMRGAVLNDTVHYPEVMALQLGVQLLLGMLLVAYGTIMNFK